jgi:hypothetical protein
LRRVAVDVIDRRSPRGLEPRLGFWILLVDPTYFETDYNVEENISWILAL